MITTKSKPAINLLESAKRVLRLEIEGLKALSASLDETFNETLRLISTMQGRAIVTGMGKSGHIANKIAATMASTGTPAFFVHPGEASHGDLGMITTGDVVIALSFSGETAELADLVAYTKRFEIPLVGITGSSSSALAEESSVALVLPDLNEACPMGLAPTTSTTAMLALGDALAVAMLEEKVFSSDDHRSHRRQKWMLNGLKAKDDLSFLFSDNDRTLGQTAILFPLSQKNICTVLPNFTNKDEILEYSKCSYLEPISDNDIDKINNLWVDSHSDLLEQPFSNSETKPTPT